MVDKEPVTEGAGLTAGEPPATETKKSMPRGRVILFSKWCKRCGICVAFCPRHVLGHANDGSVLVINSEECTACRWCEYHCPDLAITVKGIEEC